jgi:hypothetical protein
MFRNIQLSLVSCVLLGLFCLSAAALQADVPLSLERPIRPSRPVSNALGRLNLQPSSVGANLELLAIGSVDVAPTSTLVITISSSDATKLLLSPLSSDALGTNAGVASFTAPLLAGKGINGNGFPAFWIQSLASSGTAQITMTAPGYTAASATITLTPSGFVLSGPSGTGTNFSTQLGAADTNLTISAAQLDSSGNILLTNQRLRGGLTVSVPLNNGTPATASINGSPISLQGGSSSNALGTLTFHPITAGTTVLSINQPSGFTAPATGGQLTATVNAPAVSLIPNVVGYKLQVFSTGSLNTAAPAGGLLVTITSSDSTKALLTTNPAVAGSGSITVTVPASSTVLPAFYIQGLVPSGSVTLTASAPGYVNGSANVLLNPSGFLINSPNGGGNFTTTTLSSVTSLTVSVWQLNSAGAAVSQGQLAGGQSASVGVVSGTTSTGDVCVTLNPCVNGPLPFQAGDSSNSGLLFLPKQSGTTVLSVTQPAGFSTPSSGGQITATVTQPSVTLRMTLTVIGNNLQVLGSGALDAPAPTDMQLTITSSDPSKVLLSTSPTAAGSASINVTVFQGGGVGSIGFPNYYVQALSGTGTVQLTVSAPGSGFASSSFNVTLAPSGFVLEGPNGIGQNFGTLLSNGNVTMTVRAAVLDPNTLNPTLVYEAVRGGFAATVNVSSDNSSVATIAGTPVGVNAGDAGGTITLQPVAAGTATISLTAPAGFVGPASGDHLTVIVN